MQPKAPYADCDNCPLADRPCVPSYIPRNARLLVVGEAPGSDEVKTGRPFTGPSGQLLDRAVQFAGGNPAEIGRTNAVLCRPEGNATPPASAVAACAKRLAHDVTQAAPQAIIPMGNTALEAVDALSLKTAANGRSITSRRGKWYTVAHFNVLPTYHPAYILRSPQYINQFLTDVQKAVRNITSGGRKPFNTDDVQFISCNDSNKHRVIEYLDRMPAGAALAFDVETENLQWYETPENPGGKLLAIGLAWQPNRVVIIPLHYVMHADHYDVYQSVQAAFDRGNVVAHNGKFDQHAIGRWVDLYPVITYDTMLAHYALNEEKGTHDLKTLISDWLDCDDDYEDRLITSWFNKHKIKQADRNYGMIPPERLHEYLAIDVAGTLELWARLRPALESAGLFEWPFMHVLMPVANGIQQVESNGIMIDRAYVQQLGVYIDNELSKITTPMRALVQERVSTWLAAGKINIPRADWIKNRDTYAKCIVKIRDAFNPSSWQQVQVFLYDVLKLKHTKKLGYKTDPRSTAEEALLSLYPNDTSGFIGMMFELRRLEKIRGTYVNKLLAMADLDDRVHINYLVHGTEIGRLSATDAMHGIPRPGDVNPITGAKDIYGGAIRGAFIAPAGKVLVIADFSQAELRAFAAESGEPTMLVPYNNGDDLHDATAEMIEAGVYEYFKHHFLLDHNGDWAATKKCVICKEIRTLAKNVNFGEIYQGGPYGIWSMLGGKVPLNVVANVLKIKRQRQRVAAAWKETQFQTARAQGFVKTRFGRMRRFPLITDDNIDEVKKACVHAPIASGASDLTELSIVALVERGIMVCGTWHDSIIAEAYTEQADFTAEVMQTTMQDMGARFYPEVVWKVDVDIQKRWYMEIPDLTIG